MAAKKKEKEDLGLELTIESINKEFGAETLFRVGAQGRAIAVPKFSSGSPKIDLALGGGYPIGRIIEIFGPESSGKTTLCLHAIKEIQRLGGLCAFIDAEHALDVSYAASLGVDTDKLLIAQPGSGEEGLRILDKLVRTGKVKLVIVDSVAALVPKAEIDGEIGDSHVGLQARLMGQTLRMVTGKANETGTTIIFTNQIRYKIGVMFGNPETTPGGNALKFYASQRLDVRRAATNKDATGESISNLTRVKVIKNKVAPPFREAEVDIEFGTGLNLYAEILDLAEQYGVVQRAGAWYSYKAERIGQGRTNTIAFLKANPAIFEPMHEAVKVHLFGAIAQIQAEAPPTEEIEENIDE